MHSSSNDLDMSIDANRELSQNYSQNDKRVVPDESTCFEPSHLDLHCLHRSLYQSTGLKELSFIHLAGMG